MPTLMKFELGFDILQFEDGADYPANRPLEKIQITDRVASGALQSESLGVSLNRRVLNFKDMLKQDHDALKTWFDDIANGVENAFEFTDERDFTGTVKILDNVFDFPEDDFELFSGSLTLEYQ